MDLIDRKVLERINYYARARRVVEFIQAHPRCAVSLEEAASVACMERTAFSRWFSQHIGVTFSVFMRLHRIHTAVRFMTREEISVSEAAARVGYKSVSTFRRHFKCIAGLPPSRFREVARHQPPATR